MPDIRPFRALRFEPEITGDLNAVVAPPYDVIGPDLRRTLVARDPHNAVRLDLPASEPGEDPDEKYRRAARELAAWRSSGALRKDPKPSLYVLEQVYTVPGTDVQRTQRGFFARLRLEAFGPGSGVLPHERTLSGPKEDRYRLLRATGTNTSPVVMLYEDVSGTAASCLAAIAAGSPDIDVTDDDGTRHRLWVVPADEDPDGAVATLTRLAGANPIAIADGHHRYETSIRYRDERRMTRSCEPDPPFDFVLALMLETTAEALTVLPTHRVVRGLGAKGLETLHASLGELFSVTPVAKDDVVARYAAAGSLAGGIGRFGLVTRAGAFELEARRDAFDGLLSGGEAVRALDVAMVGAALERLVGIDAAAAAAGGRLTYTKSATEAASLVDAGTDDADAAFLLEPTPVHSILAVAGAGDVMPQKSTYFFPKALTGLLLNPHEW